MRWLLTLPLLLFASYDLRLGTLYNSLDPESLSELFAFYTLYPETEHGKKALENVWGLIQKHRPYESRLPDHFILPTIDITSLVRLVNKQPMDEPPTLTVQQLTSIERLCSHLKNRTLRGYRVWKTTEMETLSSDEIDLARALLLYQYKEEPQKIRQYEVALDLMALQILARLKPCPSDEEKISAISHYIFHEMRFRFPPHSLYADDIDLYTFLPSVIDSRKGVCLGVSILYLSLAQRIGVPLTIITPPGHIFLRHGEQNIETTARGIHIPDERYLGINTRSLWQRTMKEVVGMAFVNQASIAWQTKNHTIAIELYERALSYMKNDPLLIMFLGYNYLFAGQIEKGRKCLEQIAGKTIPGAVYKETMPEDYLAGRIDEEGIALAYSHVDDTGKTIRDKQAALQKKLEKYPKFRGGLFHLAITHLQLGRQGEALETLEKLHALCPHDPTVEYYLATLSLDRLSFEKAWRYYENAHAITTAADHSPKALLALKSRLRFAYPK